MGREAGDGDQKTIGSHGITMLRGLVVVLVVCGYDTHTWIILPSGPSSSAYDSDTSHDSYQ